MVRVPPAFVAAGALRVDYIELVEKSNHVPADLPADLETVQSPSRREQALIDSIGHPAQLFRRRLIGSTSARMVLTTSAESACSTFPVNMIAF